MKRSTVIILAVIVAAIGAYFLFLHKSSDANKAEDQQQPLAISKNSEGLNTAFTTLLTAYDSLHTAFVDWDTALVNVKAERLGSLLNEFPVNEIKADSTLVLTARTYVDAAAAEASAIKAEPNIEGKRRSFYTLSENIYTLATTVRYDQNVLYHVNCPMAFNDEEEAFWVSRKNEVVNPYLGTKHPKYKDGMLHCGEVKDSLDLRSK